MWQDWFYKYQKVKNKNKMSKEEAIEWLTTMKMMMQESLRKSDFYYKISCLNTSKIVEALDIILEELE